jgi:hypothetical protein
MSFSNNPYRWFTFFTTSDGKHVVLECGGCGGETGPFPVTVGVDLLINEQREHLMESHDRYPQDFADWGQPNHRDAKPQLDSLNREIEPVEPAPEWVAAEWQHVLIGDHVRIGQSEADVTTSSNSVAGAGDFHAHEDGWVWSEELKKNVMAVSRWDHKEVRVRLAHLGETVLEFPPGGPVEILMNRERAAIHLLQTQLDAQPVQK